MFCRNCGKEVVGDAKFCGSCGFNQESAVTAGQPNSTDLTGSQTKEADKNDFSALIKEYAKYNKSKDFALSVFNLIIGVAVPLLMLIPFFGVHIEIEGFVIFSADFNAFNLIRNMLDGAHVSGEPTYWQMLFMDGESLHSEVRVWTIVSAIFVIIALLVCIGTVLEAVTGLVKGDHRRGGKFIADFLEKQGSANLEFEHMATVKASEFFGEFILNLVLWAVPAVIFYMAHSTFGSVLIDEGELCRDCIVGLFPVVFAVFSGLVIVIKILISVGFRIKFAEKVKEFYEKK